MRHEPDHEQNQSENDHDEPRFAAMCAVGTDPGLPRRCCRKRRRRASSADRPRYRVPGLPAIDRSTDTGVRLVPWEHRRGRTFEPHARERRQETGAPNPYGGHRVLVQRQFGLAVLGAIVEDTPPTDRYGRTRARVGAVHRWAVAVDDGCLVFADTAYVTIAPGTRRSGPGLAQLAERPSGRACPGCPGCSGIGCRRR